MAVSMAAKIMASAKISIAINIINNIMAIWRYQRKKEKRKWRKSKIINNGVISARNESSYNVIAGENHRKRISVISESIKK